MLTDGESEVVPSSVSLTVGKAVVLNVGKEVGSFVWPSNVGDILEVGKYVGIDVVVPFSLF